MKKTFLSPGRLDAFHNLITLFPETIHFHQCFRRMLKVAVDNGNTISFCFGKPRKNSRLFSEVSGKLNSLDTSIFLRQSFNDFKRSVLRSVGNKNKFIIDICFFQNIAYGSRCCLNIFFFVVGRNDNR